LFFGYRELGGITYRYSGTMDEVSLYNRALSAAEIQNIYVAGSAGKCLGSPTPPSIIFQPTSRTVTVEETATFSVTAIGTAPLSYQWRFNEADLVGATGPSILLSNVQLAQAGNYNVIVSNAVGSVTSAVAVLTVNPTPSCMPAPAGLVAWWPLDGSTSEI